MSYPRILVINDEENYLSLLSKILGKEGFEVKTTTNIDEALNWLEHGPFDLAILDIGMRPLDGFSILERIRAYQPEMKVIMLTAYRDDETRKLAHQKGAVAYLIKPIDINELIEAVRRHLRP